MLTTVGSVEGRKKEKERRKEEKKKKVATARTSSILSAFPASISFPRTAEKRDREGKRRKGREKRGREIGERVKKKVHNFIHALTASYSFSSSKDADNRR